MADLAIRPMLWPAISSFRRLQYVLLTYLIKAYFAVSFTVRHALYATKLVARGSQPTMSKAYPCRPRLKHRIFFPSSYQAGNALPLYINIHGGGFTFGTPEHDDDFCHWFSNRFGLLVASLEYSLSPWAMFPEPTFDVAVVIQALLSDEELPIDRSRVAVGGFSAGGNLALSASQVPALRGKIKAAIPWYAPVDWTHDYAYKIASRTYKNPGDVDSLAAIAPLFNNMYLKPGTDQRDPLLSILFADRAALPPWIYVISAEYDILCDEARRMMFRLADLKNPTHAEREQISKDGGRLQWRMVPGVEHSFTHWWLMSKDKAKAARPVAELWFERAGTWLTEQAFA